MLGFTSIDLILVIGGIVYRPFTGFDASAVQMSQGLEKTDSQVLAGILDASGMSRQEIEAGIYAGAEVRRFLVNYLDLPSSFDPVSNPKFLELPRSYLAEFKRNNLGYEAKAKDELSKLDRLIGETTSMTCRANLGDDRCRVNLAGFTHNVTVEHVDSRRKFAITGEFPKNYFDRGRLKFTSGNNIDVHRDIGFHAGTHLILYEPLPFDVAQGDNLTVVAGCLKTELACVVKFRNFANFVGEPDIPTTDLAVNTPSK